MALSDQSASNDFGSPPADNDFSGQAQDVFQLSAMAGPLYQNEVRMGPRSGTDDKPMSNSQRREIGELAVWTLSSAKHGNGVLQLRDDSNSTFWQSDGQQPHLVNIQFLKKTRVGELALFLDFKTDESYTPQKISIRVANSFHELQEIKVIEFMEPLGWYVFPLNDRNRPTVKTMHIQIAILQNQ